MAALSQNCRAPLNAQACAHTLDLYERGRGCRAAAAERAVLVCEIGGPSLYRRSRCGAGGLIGAAAAHSYMRGDVAVVVAVRRRSARCWCARLVAHPYIGARGAAREV